MERKINFQFDFILKMKEGHLNVKSLSLESLPFMHRKHLMYLECFDTIITFLLLILFYIKVKHRLPPLYGLQCYYFCAMLSMCKMNMLLYSVELIKTIHFTEVL